MIILNRRIPHKCTVASVSNDKHSASAKSESAGSASAKSVSVMISTELWRARIGLFNISRRRQRLRQCRTDLARAQARVRESLTSPSTCTADYHSINGSSSIGILSGVGLVVTILAAIFFQQLIISGDVEINPGPIASDKPKGFELITLTKADGTKLEIIKRITSHKYWKCVDFAGLLLRDDVTLQRYQSDEISKDEYVRKVLRNWLCRNDDDPTDPAVPRTWEALAKCITDAGLDPTLAKAIRDTCHQPDSEYHPRHTHLSHIPSQAPVLTHQLTSYRQYLKELYRKEYPVYFKPQFTHHRPEQIVNLVLVHKKRNEADRLQRECLLYQLHGNVDLIQKKKTTLTKEQIGLLADGRIANWVLIEGAPGIGKTTLLWQLCHQWATGELLQQWELVILLQLKEEITRNAQSLSDLIYHPNEDISKAVCRLVQLQEGENVLLMFDGYDELSNGKPNESIFLKILRQTRVYAALRKATIIVSSRPFATKALPHQFKDSLDQHVEVLGFKEQDITKYLTSACKNNLDMLKDLKSYISTHPFISSLLYNPLHCTIVTELYLQYWQDGEKRFAPNTLTELYEALLLNLLRQHLNLDATPVWKDLQPTIKHQLNNLAELAAKGIEQGCYIFDNVPGDTLSIMHSVKQLDNCRPNRSRSYTFVHLTLQEFLAARYWSQLTPEHLMELLQQQHLFPVQSYLEGKHCKTKEACRVTHWPVLLFLAGLTKLTNIPIELITPWTSQRFSQSLNTGDKPIEFHPSLCHLLFETQSPHLVSTVFSGRKIKTNYYKMTSSLDWFATGYCISHSDATSSWHVVFGSSVSTPSPQCLQAFSSGLHCSPNNGALKELNLSTDIHNDVSSYLDIFPTLYPYTHAITVLELWGYMYVDDKGGPHSVLQQLLHYCPHLRELTIPRFHPPYLSFILQLPQTLDTLYLTLPLMKDDKHDAVFISHLKQCLALRHLVLYPVIKDTDITPLLTNISPLLAEQIDYLELNGVFINNGCIGALINTLVSPNSSLRKLELSWCTISRQNYSQLTTAISTSNLTHFTTKHSLYHEDHFDTSTLAAAIDELSTTLKNSKTLEEVELFEDSINSKFAKMLAEAMNHSGVKKLYIAYVTGSTVDCSYPIDRVEILYA